MKRGIVTVFGSILIALGLMLVIGACSVLEQFGNLVVDRQPRTTATPPVQTQVWLDLTATTVAQGATQAYERLQQQAIATLTAQVMNPTATAAAIALAQVSPAALARYEGLETTRSQDGYPVLGDPSAPVQVAVYTSFDCPACRIFHEEYQDDLIERVRAGDVALILVPLYGTGSIANGQGAARAALCAAEQGAFWQFQELLFDWQGRYVNQAFTDTHILMGVDWLGLDSSVFLDCVARDRPDRILDNSMSDAINLVNFIGTPTITINDVVPLNAGQQPVSGQDVIAAIDLAISRTPIGQLETRIPSLSLQFGRVVSASNIDQYGCPVDPTDNYRPSDAIYIVMEESDIPQGTSVFARLFRDGMPVEDSDVITADRDYTNTCVYFIFEATPVAEVLEQGDYSAQIIVNGNPGELVTFEVR
jgi:protein-disulfide isomerase